MEIQEAYVSFEVAKLLKEKGFDEPCCCYYFFGRLRKVNYYERNSEAKYLAEAEHCSVPTHQLACAWLRNEHDIDMWVEYCIPDDAYVYTILIKDITEGFTIIHSEDNYPTYEKATEAGLKYCLENLI